MAKISISSINYSGAGKVVMENKSENNGKQMPKLWKTNRGVDNTLWKTSSPQSSKIHKQENATLKSCLDGCPSYSTKERHRHRWQSEHGCTRGLAAGTEVYCAWHGVPEQTRLPGDEWR